MLRGVSEHEVRPNSGWQLAYTLNGGFGSPGPRRDGQLPAKSGQSQIGVLVNGGPSRALLRTSQRRWAISSTRARP
jgi:hypothetical protein